MMETSSHRVGEPVLPARVVVVRKTTVLERQEDRPDPALARVLAERGALAQRISMAHSQHLETFRQVINDLRASGVELRVVAQLTRRDARWADLVVTVGGDGTFLRASHAIVADGDSDGTPMLGVNSATSSSVGFFCATTATGFAPMLGDLLSGRRRTRGLWRMRVLLGDRVIPDLALNDVLIAHRVPAETTRYTLRVDDRSQAQASSGVWVATSAGSTGAIRSAGGDVLSLDERRLQYRVRELLPTPEEGRVPLIGGLVESELEILSHIPTGVLYLDGGHQTVRFGYGDRIRLTVAERPMPWIARDDMGERRQAFSRFSARALAAAGIVKPDPAALTPPERD